jgi:multicomponent K+:H+ antiporter subunit A
MVSAIVATLAGIFAVAYSIRLVHGVFLMVLLVKMYPIKKPMNPHLVCVHLQLYWRFYVF